MINRAGFIKRCLVGAIGIAFDPLKNIPLLGPAIKKEVLGIVRPKTKKARGFILLTPKDITREALKVLHKNMVLRTASPASSIKVHGEDGERKLKATKTLTNL